MRAMKLGLISLLVAAVAATVVTSETLAGNAVQKAGQTVLSAPTGF